MKIKSAFVFLGILSLCIQIGCQDTNSPDENGRSTDQLSYETVNSDLGAMKDGGMELDSAAGVFSIGWNEMFRPFEDSGEVRGMSFAVGFGERETDLTHFRRYGLDMGNVFINYSGNHIELYKRYHPVRGTAYTLFERPFGFCGPDSLLQYIPNTEYQFEVTGSEAFAPITISLTSPSSLMDITAPSSGTVINPNENLTITWQGGNTDQKTVIRLMPNPKPPRDPRRHHMPPPPDPRFDKVITVILNNNPGTYTFTSGQILEMLSGLEADGIAAEVSQVDIGEVNHPNGMLKTAMRNGSNVKLRIE